MVRLRCHLGGRRSRQARSGVRAPRLECGLWALRMLERGMPIAHAAIDPPMHLLLLQPTPQPLDAALTRQAPRPSMLIAIFGIAAVR